MWFKITYDYKCHIWDFLMDSGDWIQVLLLEMKTLNYLIKTELSPHRLPSLFFHFVVLFFNPSINSYNVSKENKTSPKEKLQGRKTVQHVGRRYILVKSRGIALWLTYRKFVQAFKDQFEKTFCKKHVARFGVYQDRLAKLQKHLFSPTSKIV